MFLTIYVGILHALPPPANKNTETLKQIPVGDLHLLHPHIITIDRLEALLRRASEIFKPVPVKPNDSPSLDTERLTVPIQYMQPPNQPYNFYLPLFDYDEDSTKLDDKARKMENFTPPPKPKDGQNIANFYDIKPKKSPKKFNAATKHINIKWLNNYEKQLSSPNNKQSVNIPKDVYLMNDERNRINFDDSFFAVDMKVPDRANKLDKQPNESESGQQNEDYLNQGEEDLIAAAALQIPLIRDLASSRRM